MTTLPKPYYDDGNGVVIYFENNLMYDILSVCKPVSSADQNGAWGRRGKCAKDATCDGSGSNGGQSTPEQARQTETCASADVVPIATGGKTHGFLDTKSEFQMPTQRWSLAITCAYVGAARLLRQSVNTYADIPLGSGSTQRQAKKPKLKCRWRVRESRSRRSTSKPFVRLGKNAETPTRPIVSKSEGGLNTEYGETPYLRGTGTHAKSAGRETGTERPFTSKPTTLSRWQSGPILCLRSETE